MTDKKTKRISIRFTEEEYNQLENVRQELRCDTISELIRIILNPRINELNNVRQRTQDKTASDKQDII